MQLTKAQALQLYKACNVHLRPAEIKLTYECDDRASLPSLEAQVEHALSTCPPLSRKRLLPTAYDQTYGPFGGHRLVATIKAESTAAFGSANLALDKVELSKIAGCLDAFGAINHNAKAIICAGIGGAQKSP